VLMSAEDPALRALAREMAMEEQEHIAMVERLLERTPDPGAERQVLFGP